MGKNAKVTEPKSGLDQALELLVYAPVGLAVAARDLVPGLVERGRQQLDPQVDVARTVGQLAVAQGRAQTGKVLDRALSQAQATLAQLGVLPREGASPAGQPTAPATRPPEATTVAQAPAGAPGRDRDGPAAAGLAIPDYDSLSASQVVPRLPNLSAAELESVRAYEDAHRGRKTVLNKIAQLQGT